MRFFPALFGALLITVAVFLFMQSLIQRGKDEGVQLVVHRDVQILRQEPQEEPEQDPDTPEEPLMDALPAMEISPPAPQLANKLELPALDLGVGDIDIQASGKRWSAPLEAGSIAVTASGQDAQGFEKVAVAEKGRA